MFKKSSFLFVFLLTLQNGFSQDAFFTNTNQSLIYLNPSFAGTNGFVRMQSVFRQQDYNSRIPFKTLYTGLDAYVKPLNGGIAFSFLSDNQVKGLIKTTAPAFTYAQHIYAYNKTIKIIPAIQGMYFIKSLDLANINYKDTIDQRKLYTLNQPKNSGYSEPLSQKTYFDVNASVLIQAKNLTVGLAMFHLNQPDEGVAGPEKLPFKMNIHGAYNFVVTPDLNISLFALFINQGDFKDYNFNCNLSWQKEFFFGLGMRKTNALTANIAFQTDAFRLGLGYDYGLNTLNTNIYGRNTFELMLSLNFANKNSDNSPSAEWLTW